jgi:hypothetical protein
MMNKSFFYSNFYRIQLKGENSFIGITSFRINSNDLNAFSLFNEVNNANKMNDRILFTFELQNYTFNAQLYSIKWDQSLEDIISKNKKHLSLIDTAIIYNNSPANLNHEVSSDKSLSQSFTTSFGSSTKFLQSFSTSNTQSTSDTHSK